MLYYIAIMERRAYLSSGLALVAILSGCSSTLIGDQTTNKEASVKSQTQKQQSTKATCSASNTSLNQSRTQARKRGIDTPTAAIEAYYEALYTGDAKTANGLLHNDSPIAERSSESLSDLKHFQHRLADVQSTENQSNLATVAFTLVLVAPDGDTERRETEVQVKEVCGGWRIWE
jgi:hypothetical protein